MENKDIKNLCLETQKRQTQDGYPDYKFRVTQTQKTVKIFWEYLDGEAFTIDKKTGMAKNEHGEIINNYFDYDDNLESVIKSCVYYMVTRY